MMFAMRSAASYAVLILFLILPGGPGLADVLVNDPFTDGSRSNTSSGDAQGLVWYASSTTSGLLIVTNDSAGIGTGNALLLGALASYGHGQGYFGPLQLAGPGDSLQVACDFRFGSAPPTNVWATLRLGVYDSKLTRVGTDGSMSPNYDDEGYGVFLSNPGLAGSNLSLYSEIPGTNDDILGGPSPGALVGIGSAGASPACGTGKHTLSLQLSRLINGDLSLQAQLDSGSIAQTTIPAASVLTYTFDEIGLGRGNTTVAILLDNLVITGTSSTNSGGVESDALRRKWFDYLTGGTNLNLSDPTTLNAIKNITNSANSNWRNMDTSATRTYLWSDLTSTTVSAQITSAYNRLNAMALGWAVTGSSLYHNSALAADLISALDWMYTNRYNETLSEYGNWWDWEIGAPMALNDTCVLMHDALTPQQLAKYLAPVNKFTPTPNMTGANQVWKVRVVGVRGALVQDAAKLTLARDSLSPVFPYVTSGDGFYTDGSFIQHSKHPYTGGYGASLLSNLAPLLTWLKGSPWEVVDAQQTNVVSWIFNAYQPLLYRGAMMDMVRGREVSRSGSGDHGSGNGIMQSILRVAGFAPPADAARIRSLVKALAQGETSRDFVAGCPLSLVRAAQQLMADTNVVPRPELVGHFQFPAMARVVHLRPGFGLGLSLYSSRIYDYESINGENLHAWFAGSGMTYLYNGDLTHYNDNYWPTVNPYRLPGTTVPTATRANGYGQSQTSSYNWVGGATLDGLYGAVGMEAGSYGNSLTARKSWFCFDDEIVALGAGITSGDSSAIESIVENRMMTTAATNAFTVNGVVQPNTLGWSNSFSGLSWAHLAGDVAGSDIGYYFPQPLTLRALREARTNSWNQINTNGSTTLYTRNYLTLWIDHGLKPTNATYAWVLLPNKSASAVSSYAASAHVQVVENSSQAQAVREDRLGILAVNFWEAASKTVDYLTSNTKASVLARELPDTLTVAVSDPTQANAGNITLALNRSAVGVVSVDPGVTVNRLQPTIQLTASVSGRRGLPLNARFLLYTNAPPTLAPVEGRTIMAGATLTVTNYGSDSEIAPQALRYSLLTAPLGATVIPTNGVVSWRPTIAQAGTSNRLDLVVSEDGWVTNLPPIGDVFARDGAYASSNYGADASLVVKLSSSGLTRESFVKFALPAMHGTVADARLRVACTYSSVPGLHALAQTPDSLWDELGLNWTNKPASGPALATWAPQAGTTVELPVTVQAAQAQTNDPGLSFRLHSTTSTSDGYVTYDSRESSGNAPALLVRTTNAAPLSATQSFWVTVTAPPAPTVAPSQLGDGRFQLALADTELGPDYIFEGSTNLQDWTALWVTNATGSTVVWTDSSSTNYGRRFYRVRLGP